MFKDKTFQDIFLKYWLPVMVWALVIFLFSSFPTKPVSEIQWSDFIVKKSAHVTEYGILTLLLYRAFRRVGYSKKKTVVFSIIVSIFYAVTDEFHQSFTPGREPKVRDVLFDGLGSILAVYFISRYPGFFDKITALVFRNNNN